MPRFCRIASAVGVFAVAVVLLAGADRGVAGDAPVAIGRHAKAMPWLHELGDMPFVVVPLSSIPALAGLPAKTAHYEIDDDVVASGYGYYFYVRGIEREYMVGSHIKIIQIGRAHV